MSQSRWKTMALRAAVPMSVVLVVFVGVHAYGTWLVRERVVLAEARGESAGGPLTAALVSKYADDVLNKLLAVASSVLGSPIQSVGLDLEIRNPDGELIHREELEPPYAYDIPEGISTPRVRWLVPGTSLQASWDDRTRTVEIPPRSP